MADKDFFLSPDDAQTLGDINYMRTAKRVRKTFPKTLKNKDGFETITEVSSVEDRSGIYKNNETRNTISNTVFNPTPSSQSQPGITGGSAVTQTKMTQSQPSISSGSNVDSSKSPEERRQKDNGMDMFRNMAKNIRRGR